MRELILASGSPRRSQLLTALGIAFTVHVADVDESPRPGEAPESLVVRLSRMKAAAVAHRYLGAAVLAADTIVVLDGEILGKPAGPRGAVEMLRALRDRAHTVYTGVCVAMDGQAETRLSTSQVFMRDYTDAEIDAYVATGDPLDKAGAYAIQHPAFSPVSRWEGCYTGIMGLPMRDVATLLSGAGIVIGADVAVVCARVSGERCCAAIPIGENRQS